MLSPAERQKVAERYTIALAAAVFAILLRCALSRCSAMSLSTRPCICGCICALICAQVRGLNRADGLFRDLLLFVDPRHSVAVGRSQTHAVIGFFLVCAVLIWLGEANRRKQLRLNSAVVALTRNE